LDLPYEPLGRFPTAIDKASRFGIPELYIKRDDRSDPEFGGSKARKLAFLLGEARRLASKRVVTFGSVGSNQAMATALFGKRMGLPVTLMLAPETPSCRVGDLLLAEHELGAEQRFFSSIVQAVEASRRMTDAYVIFPGASTPLGNAGFVDAAFELQEQVAAGLLPEPDYVYIAMGTMGSAVGLAIGLKAAGMKTRVVPVRVSSEAAASAEKMRKMIVSTLEYLRAREPSFPSAAPELEIRQGYVGPGYARESAAGRRAMQLAPEVGLDPTYTAKAFAALLNDAPALQDKVVVFWATQSAVHPKPKGRLQDLPSALQRYGCPGD
jgi:D-cysteine desulfhydrase